LYKSDDTLIANQNGSNDVNLIENNVAAGTYIVRIMNSSSTTDVTYSLEILSDTGNQPPVANDKTYQVDLNGTITGNIITDNPADSDPDGDSISINSADTMSLPGTLDLNMTDGNFTYSAPEGDTCDIYTFDYNITDGKGGISNTATITIDVQNILIAVNDYFVTGINQATPFNVLDNEENLSYSILSHDPISTAGATISIDKYGNFTYTPPSSTFSGQDSFDYNITDGTCSTVTATATITVTNMCEDAIDITDRLCTGNIDITVVAGTPQAYYFTVPKSVLDINITNTGQKELQYDFQQANCGKVFTSGTTSYLPHGDSIDIKKVYSADTYFLGFNVGQVQTHVRFSICHDTNTSGFSGDFVNSNIGVNEIGVDYDSDKNITTKVVNKPFGVSVVMSTLNSFGRMAKLSSEQGSSSNASARQAAHPKSILYMSGEISSLDFLPPQLPR